ncbi:glycoside hydrolase [Thraustotheca clavata]|uniref:Glycoside hydrolase n=1 Tax=Thraustotheca clavata TaxID=74557 RepID=A0A1V9ZGU5_9STRA|nr:glycoside hydrolase [Thraustotheca clavata]
MAMLRQVLRHGLTGVVLSRHQSPVRLAGAATLLAGAATMSSKQFAAHCEQICVNEQRPAWHSSNIAILPVATTLWSRLARIIRLLLHCGHLFVVSVPLVVTFPVARLMEKDLPQWWWKLALWSGANSSPAIIKFLQWASTRRDLFSVNFCNTFQAFHSHVHTHKWSFTESILNDAFGPEWHKQFTIDPEPIGSGVIAQVYQGTKTSTNEKIAVKVIHPCIRDQIAVDLELLWCGACVIDYFLPNLSAKVGMMSFAQVMSSQLDFRIEAANLTEFRRHFAKRTGVTFPTPDPLFSHSNVLVESFVSGSHIMDHITAQHSYDRPLATLTIDTFLRMLFLDNFAHGDIHPGNILVTENRGIALLDAGIVNVLQPQDYDDFIELFHSIVNRDGYLAGQILLEKSPRHHCENPHAFCTGIASLVERATTNLNLKQVPVGDLLTEVLELCGRHQVALQGRFVSVVVSIGVLEGVGRLLDPELDLLQIALPILLKDANQYSLHLFNIILTVKLTRSLLLSTIIHMTLLWLIAIVFFLLVLLVACFLWFANAMYDSIGCELPTDEMLADNSSVLFRHLPFLKSQVAWRPLGVFPTPVHTARLPHNNKTFLLKREDLSSPLYGGNKVRTLQHQLAACEVHLDRQPDATFLCIGSAGSNQVVAAMAHGNKLQLPIVPCYIKPDAPDLDNTLNFLSTLSWNPLKVHFWRHKRVMLQALFQAVRYGTNKVFFMGGNNCLGVLGQMGAILELAEQIENGISPDIDELYLPIGSACTLTGLILGICLSRHLGIKAFMKPSFKIVAIPIHPASAGVERKFKFYTSAFWKLIPLTPRFGFRKVSGFLRSKGLDVDLEPLAIAFLKEHVEIVADAKLVGEYGAHSPQSASAAAFDAHLEISGPIPSWMDKESKVQSLRPWICGHFVAKSFAVLLDRIEKEEDDKTRMLWQTKSIVQPRGPADEWSHFQSLCETCPILKDWANNGLASSVLRRGHVLVPNGSRASYEPLMTSLE